MNAHVVPMAKNYFVLVTIALKNDMSGGRSLQNGVPYFSSFLPLPSHSVCEARGGGRAKPAKQYE